METVLARWQAPFTRNRIDPFDRGPRWARCERGTARGPWASPRVAATKVVRVDASFLALRPEMRDRAPGCAVQAPGTTLNCRRGPLPEPHRPAVSAQRCLGVVGRDLAALAHGARLKGGCEGFEDLGSAANLGPVIPGQDLERCGQTRRTAGWGAGCRSGTVRCATRCGRYRWGRCAVRR